MGQKQRLMKQRICFGVGTVQLDQMPVNGCLLSHKRNMDQLSGNMYAQTCCRKAMMRRPYGIDENEGSLGIQSIDHLPMFLELVQLVDLPSCSEVGRMVAR